MEKSMDETKRYKDLVDAHVIADVNDIVQLHLDEPGPIYDSMSRAEGLLLFDGDQPRLDSDGYEREIDVAQWWSVSQPFAAAAKDAGELIFSTPFGYVWGCETVGMDLADLKNVQAIVDNMDLPTVPATQLERDELLVRLHVVANATGYIHDLQDNVPESKILVDIDKAIDWQLMEASSRALADGCHEPDVAQVMQWFTVSDEFAKRAETNGEVVVDTEIGKLWGRQGCGQHVSMDMEVQRIVQSMELPSFIEKASVPTTAADLQRELAAGGGVKSSAKVEAGRSL